MAEQGEAGGARVCGGCGGEGGAQGGRGGIYKAAGSNLGRRAEEGVGERHGEISGGLLSERVAGKTELTYGVGLSAGKRDAVLGSGAVENGSARWLSLTCGPRRGGGTRAGSRWGGATRGWATWAGAGRKAGTR